MDHFAGLDVSVKETSVCIVDDTGRIIREVKVASEPEALLATLRNAAYHFKRIGLEAGPLSQWLFSALADAGLPVICVETRHMKAVLKAQINKTDRNDARGIAQMMRAGLYRPVHVKTLRSQKLRMLLTHRQLLQSKAIAIENDLRATLRNFGLKVGVVGAVKFEARIHELVENHSDLAILVEPPSVHQSGELDRMGGISKCGDAMMRRVLFEAAQVMLTRTVKWSWLKGWGMKIARHRGMRRAIVAVARRMAVVMHRIWVDGTEFRWTRDGAAAA
jgi:transposase